MALIQQRTEKDQSLLRCDSIGLQLGYARGTLGMPKDFQGREGIQKTFFFSCSVGLPWFLEWTWNPPTKATGASPPPHPSNAFKHPWQEQSTGEPWGSFLSPSEYFHSSVPEVSNQKMNKKQFSSQGENIRLSPPLHPLLLILCQNLLTALRILAVIIPAAT